LLRSTRESAIRETTNITAFIQETCANGLSRDVFQRCGFTNADERWVLGPVDIYYHLILIKAAARHMMASKLVSVLQVRMAIRLNSLSF
jgi:hypothetical protein